MIVLKRGDLLQSECDALVNAVNCMGVMGRGIALQFKQKFHDMFADYQTTCKLGQLKPGGVHVFGRNEKPHYIINIATKGDWRNPSQLQYVQNGLIKLRHTINMLCIQSIAIPALGCGNGGLQWSDVLSLIRYELRDCNALVEVYEPVEDK